MSKVGRYVMPSLTAIPPTAVGSARVGDAEDARDRAEDLLRLLLAIEEHQDARAGRGLSNVHAARRRLLDVLRGIIK